MINFKTKEEKELLLHYADVFDNDTVKRILDEGVKNSDEAKVLAKFYWDMLDQTVIDEKNGKFICEDLDYYLESILYLIGGYLRLNGYAAEWDNRGK